MIDLRITRCTPATTTAPTTEGEVVSCTTGLHLSATTVCNSVGGDVTVARGVLRTEHGLSTAVGCGAPEATLSGVLLSPATRFAISGDRLRLQHGDDVLVYRAAAGTSAGALVGDGWVLAEARTDAGGLVDAEAPKPVRVRFEGCSGADCPGGLEVVGNDGCNDFAGGARLERNTLTLATTGPTAVTYTAIGCSDRLSPLVGRVLHADAIQVTLVDSRLGLRAAGVDLVFERAQAVLPEARGTELAAGRSGSVLYRLSWDRNGDQIGVYFDHSSPDTDMRASTTFDLVRSPHSLEEDSGATDIGAGHYLWGVAPPGVVRVVAETAGERTTVPMHLLEGTGLSAFGVLLDEPPDAVIGYDAGGAEVARKERR